ncbi:MAG: flagellar biosynthetic protein FlhB [Clostridia bacterium]|nr:flagellar biosynthetic protein FlhB [Clostridia bacterium]
MFEFEFVINLQLFAEERTEPATPKRRREAREKGQVAKSRDIVSAILLLVTFLALRIFGGYIFENLSKLLRFFLSFPSKTENAVEIGDLMNVYWYSVVEFAKVIAPILLISALVAVSANYLQVGFLFSIKPLIPKFNKLNPIEGFKNIFSKNAFVEFLKSAFKIAVVAYVIYSYLKKNFILIPELLAMDMMATAHFIGNTIVNTGIRVAVVLLVIAIFDYGYQFWEFEKNLRMSKQEIKEEYKMTEGNPQIKSKIREKQRQMSLRRMMTEVPKADVVITNPTHFAIAVKYDAGKADAPLVLAKGKDLIAQKIKEIAKDNNVPIVENKPLAQALYKTVEIGDMVPAELYKAVAEVLAFVYSLKNK